MQYCRLRQIMIAYLFSCEYATCTVPRAHAGLFQGHDERVTSAAGWDPGALNLAQAFAMRFSTPLVHTEVTRLLVDVQQHEDACFSDISSMLSETAQARLLERHVHAYRNQLDQRIASDLERYQQVLHVMVHTDDNLDGQVVLETGRGASLAETHAQAWVSRMSRDDLKIRHLTNAEGTPLSRELNRHHPTGSYGQIRLHVSQSFFLMGVPWRWSTIKKHLLDSLSISSRQLQDPVSS